MLPPDFVLAHYITVSVAERMQMLQTLEDILFGLLNLHIYSQFNCSSTKGQLVTIHLRLAVFH